VARVTDFQDDTYAELYLQRVDRIRAAEAAADPRGGHGNAATREAARFLALWMAYDDIARVADLKGRASRHARVRREAGARDGDVVRIADYLKPGVPEVAGVLPASLARRLVAWDRRRIARGRAPFALPMTVRTDAVGGTLGDARAGGAAARAPSRLALCRGAGDDRALARRDRARARAGLAPGLRDRAQRAPDQGLRRDQPARQAQPHAHPRPPDDRGRDS
jgi:hypothetical protein